MSIPVTCPGCLKRFEVSDKFAGMKGPCPSCSTIIQIPKSQVKVHAPDDFASGGKTVKGKAILKPLDRQVTVISIKEFLLALLVWVVVFVVALLIGRFSTSIGRWGLDLIGVVGMLAIGFATSLFGYYLLRSGDDLEFYEGEDLYKRAGICTAIYTGVWILFECFVAYMNPQGSFPFLVWVFLVPFVIGSLMGAYALFDFDFSMAFVHYSFFLICVIVFRWAIGLGWLWMAVQLVVPSGGEGNVRPSAPVL